MLRNALWLTTVCVCLAGCGEEIPVEETPQLAPVTGTDVIDGRPAAGVAVTFTPARTTTGNGAYATTGGDGAFTLEYRTGSPGIPAGDYVVLFSKLVQADGSPIPPGKTAADVMAVDQIPEKYRQSARPLNQINVPPSGGNYDFKISSR
jgi:hypothetical protein